MSSALSDAPMPSSGTAQRSVGPWLQEDRRVQADMAASTVCWSVEWWWDPGQVLIGVEKGLDGSPKGLSSSGGFRLLSVALQKINCSVRKRKARKGSEKGGERQI